MQTSQPNLAVGIAPYQRHTLLAEAMKACAQGAPRTQLLNQLVDSGFTEQSAGQSLTAIEQQLATKRSIYEQKQQSAKYKAILQVCAALALAVLCIAMGKVTTVIVLAVLAARGLSKFQEIKGRTFADSVLQTRD